jgi:hypothetical protein
MKEFFSRNPEKLVNEIKEELYVRLNHTRRLVEMYDQAADTDELTLQELGYRQGIKEEMRYIEKLLDTIERS